MALKNVVIGYAKGDKGDKGDTGERGATGQTGPQGESGNIADAAITDTQGLDVAKGAKTTAQKLFDAIADRIVNKLVTNDTLTTKLADYLLKSAMSSTNINSTTNVPTSALVYSLLQDVNNNLSKFGNLRFLTANTFADAWNKAEAGYTYFIDITSNTDSPTTTANRWFGQMWKNDTGKYGWQVAWSFNGTIYKRERNNSDAWTDWNTYALKSDLDSSKLKSMTFTAMSDEYAQIAIGNPGILICAVSNNYLLARQDNGVCRVIGDIRNNELSFKRNVKGKR